MSPLPPSSLTQHIFIGPGAYRGGINTRKRTREEAGVTKYIEEEKSGADDSKRRKLNKDVGPVLEYLKQLHDAKYPEKPKKPRKVSGPKFMMNHSYETRAYVLWLRFGSIHEECDPPLRTHRRIFEITGVKVAT